MTGNDRKRHRNGDSRDGNSNKKNKSNAWKKGQYSVTGIEVGQQGIFATCDRGREAKAVGELYGLLEECASKLYGLDDTAERIGEPEDEEEDIEAAIKKEMSDYKEKKQDKKIISVKLDAQCVAFFRLKSPCDATEMVADLCQTTVSGRRIPKFVQRLTPVTKTGKATLEGIEQLAKDVLEPHFHRGQKDIKFAIRPTSRNHNVLSRNDIIQTVARCVGPDHSVDLKNYDMLILVELYKNICGISVVKDFEKHRKFNLRELQSSSGTRAVVAEKSETKDKANEESEVTVLGEELSERMPEPAGG